MYAHRFNADRLSGPEPYGIGTVGEGRSNGGADVRLPPGGVIARETVRAVAER
jgi:hypothetical protein